MLKNMGPFLLFFLVIACGEKKSVEFGVTSRSALISQKGEPVKSESVPSGELLTYKENEKFQITDDKVTVRFRNPNGDERNLLYWRHRFRECDSSEKELSDDAVPEIEFICAKAGTSVVYVKGTGRVVRISEYERQ